MSFKIQLLRFEILCKAINKKSIMTKTIFLAHLLIIGFEGKEVRRYTDYYRGKRKYYLAAGAPWIWTCEGQRGGCPTWSPPEQQQESGINCVQLWSRCHKPPEANNANSSANRALTRQTRRTEAGLVHFRRREEGVKEPKQVARKHARFGAGEATTKPDECLQ